jgi:hypothetical protein
MRFSYVCFENKDGSWIDIPRCQATFSDTFARSLRWRQIGRQLNRGEHRQGVARHVFFADQGEFRTGDLAQIMNKASCLSLLSNAILVWNTVHISNIVDRLKKDGHSTPDEHLARVSPLLHKHVIVNGMYDFAYRQRRPMQVQ